MIFIPGSRGCAMEQASCFADARCSPGCRLTLSALVAIIAGEVYNCTDVCYTFNIFAACPLSPVGVLLSAGVTCDATVASGERRGPASARLFDPTGLKCDERARVLKEADVKMAILKAKHEDGFCLWPSKYTEYSVKYSPWKNGKGDVVREFVDACHEYELKVGLYLSPWDQQTPSFGTPAYNTY